MMSALLPSGPGLLPKWQLIVSAMAFFNSGQTLFTVKLTRRIFTSLPAQVTALQTRTFGTWTVLSAIVRVYCAYHIHEKTIYDITIWSYVVAFFYFMSEWLWFRTANLGPGLLGPLIVAPVSLLWMLNQYDYYVTG